MESTDQEAIKKYYGNNQEEESDSSESESCDEETDGTILNVKNIADTVLFISFYHDLIRISDLHKTL